MLSLLRKSALWILLAPWALTLGGAASNQLVLHANQDRFPVMWNEYKVNKYVMHLESIIQGKDKDAARLAAFELEALREADYLDDTHVVMSNKTHLNLLADIFDLHDATYSIGDALIYLGDWAWDFAPFVWGFEVIRRLRKREETQY